jgi:hypothetical protein
MHPKRKTNSRRMGLMPWLAACIILCAPQPVAAELQTFGFIELDNLVNTYADQDFADAVKKNEIRANLEIRYGRDDLHLFMKSDFYYAPNLGGDDDPYDYRYSSESEVANNLRISGTEYEADFNELYLAYQFSPFRLRLGNQLYKWGTADVLNPTAYFNPYDFREFLLRDDDQFKQGVPSLSGMYFHDRFTTELVFAFAHVPTLFAPSGNFWSLDMRNPLYTSRVEPDDSLPVAWENTGIGGRISATVGGTDLSLSAYYGPDRDPVMVPEQVAFPPNEPLLLTIEPRYHIVNMFGLDFSKTVGDFVFQAEGAYSPNKRSLVMQDLSGLDAVRIPFDTRASDFISYAAGFNYFVPTGKIFENHGGETVFTLDWYQARYADDDLYGAYFTDLLTLRLQDSFMDGRLLFKYTAMFETQHSGSIHWPELTVDFQNGWTLALAYVAIDGDRDGETFEPLFYHYRNNDFVSFKIRYLI